MIRHTRFAVSLSLAALLAACAPRDDAPAPVSLNGPQSAPVAAVTPARLTPHPSSMPSALRAAAPTIAATSAGATVVVQRGETLSAIARRHGVAATAIAQANNLKPPFGVQAGQKLTLPGVAATETFVAAAKPAPERTKTDYRPLAVRVAPIPPPAAEPVSQATVASSPRSTVQAVALSAPEPAKTPTAVGDTLKAGPARVELAKAEPFSQPRPIVSADPHSLRLPASYGKPAASTGAEPEVAPVPTAYKAMPKPTLGEPPPRAGRSFAWPVKGRVISSYGPQPGGLRNDGLNIAATRGDKVVAADNGVVAYAGGDLKGFGNLVLVKHAGGFVTTYAHNDKLMVQRGDKVKRGQVIATVGESGSVTQPQVHFQVRQGAHAVDPRPLMERS